MSKFWKAYASVTDDVRHTLVEEAWFGRRVTGDLTERDIPALAPDPVQPMSSFYGDTRAAETSPSSVYGSPAPAPETGASSLCGNAPAASPSQNAATPPERQDGPEPGF